MNKSQSEIYLGTMSGTSMDGLDLVAVRFDNHQHPTMLCHQTLPYPARLKQSLLHLAVEPSATIDAMCTADTQLGEFYAEKINDFINSYSMDRKRIFAIGSHGQTLRHSPLSTPPYTLQIGDANIIAANCGITVVADFRRRDVALGGQGAPLTPAFHQQVFRSDQVDRCIINIGGIANLTLLPQQLQSAIIGFDSGPGNTLMDSFCRQILHCEYDEDGQLAARGKADESILQAMLADPYFQLPPPKSTGTDYFSTAWMHSFGLQQLKPADALATLLELTAASIVQAAQQLTQHAAEYYVCGGGAHNQHLMERLQQYLSPASVRSTSSLGLHPDWVEACAFAWLARQTLRHQPGNIPDVTNALKPSILGAVYYPTP